MHLVWTLKAAARDIDLMMNAGGLKQALVVWQCISARVHTGRRGECNSMAEPQTRYKPVGVHAQVDSVP